MYVCVCVCVGGGGGGFLVFLYNYCHDRCCENSLISIFIVVV